MGGSLCGESGTSGLSLRSCARSGSGNRRPAHAQRAQRGPSSRQIMELRTRIPARHMRDGQFQNTGMSGRRLAAVRFEHLASWGFSLMPQPARRLRFERQCRGAYESAFERTPDVESRQQGVGLYGNEGQLVHFRHLSGARGLVPVARTVLARLPGHGSGEPCQLPPWLSLLQDPWTSNAAAAAKMTRLKPDRVAGSTDWFAAWRDV